MPTENNGKEQGRPQHWHLKTQCPRVRDTEEARNIYLSSYHSISLHTQEYCKRKPIIAVQSSSGYLSSYSSGCQPWLKLYFLCLPFTGHTICSLLNVGPLLLSTVWIPDHRLAYMTVTEGIKKKIQLRTPREENRRSSVTGSRKTSYPKPIT